MFYLLSALNGSACFLRRKEISIILNIDCAKRTQFSKTKNEYNLLYNNGLRKKSSQSTMQKRTQTKPTYSELAEPISKGELSVNA
jgi:hypothetical protein